MKVIELGCGTAAAFLGKQLRLLGFEVTHACVGSFLSHPGVCDLVDGPLGDVTQNKSLASQSSVELLKDALFESDVVVLERPPAIQALDEIRSLASPTALLAVVTPLGMAEGEARQLDDSIVAEAMTGGLGTIGFEEHTTPLGYLFGDINAGIRGAGMVVERLAGRTLGNFDSETDRLIDISIADCCIEAIENPFQELTFGGKKFHHTGSHRGGMVPYGFFPAPDGDLALVVGVGAWETLVRHMGDAELADPSWSSIETRLTHREFVIKRVADWVRSQASIADIVESIGLDIVAVKVRDFEDLWTNGSPILEIPPQDGASPDLTNPYRRITAYREAPASR